MVKAAQLGRKVALLRALRQPVDLLHRDDIRPVFGDHVRDPDQVEPPVRVGPVMNMKVMTRTVAGAPGAGLDAQPHSQGRQPAASKGSSLGSKVVFHIRENGGRYHPAK